MVLEKYLNLIKYNTNIWLKNSFVFACILVFFTPAVFSIRNTTVVSAAKICEVFVALIGIVFFSFIKLPEEKYSLFEIVKGRKVSLIKVYVVRIFLGVLSMSFIMTVFIFILKSLGGEFQSGVFIYGTFANAVYLGGISMIIVSLFNQTIIGVLVALVYSIIEMFSKGQFTKFLNVYYYLHKFKYIWSFLFLEVN